MRLLVMMAAVMAVLVTSVMPVTAQEDTSSMEWRIRSKDPKITHLKFYSQTYNRFWPGNNRVYELDDYEFHSFKLSCERGEQICFGAWDKDDGSSHWGVGKDDTNSCSDCCHVCGTGNPDPINLNPF